MAWPKAYLFFNLTHIYRRASFILMSMQFSFRGSAVHRFPYEAFFGITLKEKFLFWWIIFEERCQTEQITREKIFNVPCISKRLYCLQISLNSTLDLSQNVSHEFLINIYEIDKFWKIYKEYSLMIMNNNNKEDIYNKNIFIWENWN